MTLSPDWCASRADGELREPERLMDLSARCARQWQRISDQADSERRIRIGNRTGTHVMLMPT